MSNDKREIIRGLSLDVDILARELNHPATDAELAVRAIDRMRAVLRRLREQLASPDAPKEARDLLDDLAEAACGGAESARLAGLRLWKLAPDDAEAGEEASDAER